MTAPRQLLAAELLATADALRQCRTRLLALARLGDPAVLSAELWAVLNDGPDVADALESLAHRLATPPAGGAQP